VKKVLLTGRHGQLGHELVERVPAGIELIATGRTELDLADAEACRQAVYLHRPDWVLNAGAYTAVDQAESEQELAHAVNGAAPGAMAEALSETGGRLLQVSTDFVFNGKQGYPYGPEQSRDPLGAYGRSKVAGEEAIEQHFGRNGRGVILRTSWVMGPVGRNFALTMLRLHRERGSTGQELGVVADQVGCPTSTHSLARACWRVISADIEEPVLHWSDAGAASWYDVALAVGELGKELGLLERMAAVRPLTTAEYPTPSERPSYSLLDCSSSRRILGLAPNHWRQALRELLEAVK
jgi:dTDP-4-dehydrorhamnose reductase